MKKLLKLWTKGHKGWRQCPFKLSEDKINVISGRLLSMKACMPKEFNRKPRSLKVLTFWFRGEDKLK